jgi:hypothetical protein
MSKIKVADFYYGAALSVLFNNSNSKITAALIESDDNRQLYGLMTDKNECHLFIKYRSAKIDTKTEDYYSWLFSLTERDKSEIQALIDKGHNLVLALVCGVSGLSDSELALIDKEQVKELIDLEKDSITISRRKGEHAYRISIGGGRENAMQVAANRFEELF